MQQEIHIAAAGHLVAGAEHPIVDGSSKQAAEKARLEVHARPASWPLECSEISPAPWLPDAISGRSCQVFALPLERHSPTWNLNVVRPR